MQILYINASTYHLEHVEELVLIGNLNYRFPPLLGAGTNKLKYPSSACWSKDLPTLPRRRVARQAQAV
ncbi:MAG: hypothetical protein KAK04_00835 [Cyclobacteriaceae bacterium]|nr:hypothetical protein [Cyclobacteriaceae bacterium]